MGTISAGTPTGIAGALRSLDQALEAPPQPDAPMHWWGIVRQRLTGLHDALVSENEQPEDGWLASPRGGTVMRERNMLVQRLRTLRSDVLECPEIEAVRRGRAGARRIRVVAAYTSPVSPPGEHGGVPEWPIGTALKAVAGRDVSRGFESRPLCQDPEPGAARLRAGAGSCPAPAGRRPPPRPGGRGSRAGP
jgi:hypothetical protein